MQDNNRLWTRVLRRATYSHQCYGWQEDRIFASSVGDFAVESILAGQTGVIGGVIYGQPTLTRFEDNHAKHKPIPPELLSLIERIALKRLLFWLTEDKHEPNLLE